MQATGRAVRRQNLGRARAGAFVYVMQAVPHRAHQATGRPKPRFGCVETERAVEPLESTTTAPAPVPIQNTVRSLFGSTALHITVYSWETVHPARSSCGGVRGETARDAVAASGGW